MPGIAGRSPSYIVRQLYDFKRGVMLNLVPEGFGMIEDDGGYIVIKRVE